MTVAFKDYGIAIAKPTWRWDVFGGQQVIITMTDAYPQPSWRQRAMTRLLFGSTWERFVSRPGCQPEGSKREP